MKRPYIDLINKMAKQFEEEFEGEKNEAIKNYKVQTCCWAETYRYEPIYMCVIDGTKYYWAHGLPYCYDKLATVKRLLSRYHYGE